MQKSASENTFLSFIKKNKGALIFILIILLGVLLLCLSGSDSAPIHSDEEERIAALCSAIDGVGECSVLLNIKEGKVISAAVLCAGANSPAVEANIKKLISSLYGIGYNKVTVLKLSE